ncbi:hypothetical protein QBC37DRAFT_281739 [Rhypophila decipiens]|uniref:Uncharacterized protein n=1 Tax=Rhypophila decipiens TaxID=261697 RepID=A0AAN6YCJ5_9PEZI|nr:hypothetical protein QBC37DRAFT_281739 [Rhypophila decipiens]
MPAMEEKLRARARADHKARIPINKLDTVHRDVLIRAINNVLATEHAIFTYAQIIDGLPIADVAWDRRNPGLWGDHPLEDHEELCPGALDKAREVCPKWEPSMLSFDPKVINAYQGAAPGTKMFNTRLIELVAVALHQFGVLLHQLEFRMHQGDIEYMINWTMPKPDDAPDWWEPLEPLPTVFNNCFYTTWDIYPEGVADMVGYWAEDRILGGVVLFDRRAELDDEENLTGEPTNIYLHPSRRKVTYRITQLLDWQQQALVDFLLAEPGSGVSSPLPIIVDDRNRTRVNHWNALTHRGIYRDIWERRPLDMDQWRQAVKRPQDQLDYPESGVEMLMINRAAGDPLPEGPLKRYLEGKESIPEGPTKRMFDEYKELIGREKRVKLDVSEDETRNEEVKDDVHGEVERVEGGKNNEIGRTKEEEKGKETEKDDEEQNENGEEEQEKEGQTKTEKKNYWYTKVDTLQSLLEGFSSNKEEGPEE